MKVNVYRKGQATDTSQINEFGKPAPEKAKARSSAAPAGWRVPAGLIGLSAIPLIAGALRLIELAGGTALIPADARFTAAPLPVMLHILSVILYSLLGAFQFATGFRRRWPGWHRAAGRVLVACGLVAGLSALWMTVFYPRKDGTGDLLVAFRLLFGSAMVLSIILGYTAIRRRDVKAHRAWMLRAYAIGLGAGTQTLTLLAGSLIFSPVNVLSHDLLMGAAWAINLTVAEWAIRRGPAPLARPAATIVSNRRSSQSIENKENDPMKAIGAVKFGSPEVLQLQEVENRRPNKKKS